MSNNPSLEPPLEIEADNYRRERLRASAFEIAADDFCRVWLRCRELCRAAHETHKAYEENPTQENEDQAIVTEYFSSNCKWTNELDDLVARRLAQLHRDGFFAAGFYERLARLLAEADHAEAMSGADFLGPEEWELTSHESEPSVRR
jgi:hypothetical protein